MALDQIGVRGVFDVNQYTAGLRTYQAGMGQAEASAQKFATSSNSAMAQVAKGVAQLAVAMGAGGLAMSSALLAARVETLGIVLDTVGQRAGYTQAELQGYVKAIEDMGITTQVAIQSAIKFIQANLDMADASKLARVAQDAAVIANINSSEAFDRLLHGIVTLEPIILRTMGIIINQEQAWKTYAASINKTVDALDGAEKQQATMNAVLKAGESIAGAYEAAMGTAGKQLSSLARYTEQAQLAMGRALLPAMTQAVGLTTAFLKAFLALPESMQMVVGWIALAAAGVSSMSGVLQLASVAWLASAASATRNAAATGAVAAAAGAAAGAEAALATSMAAKTAAAGAQTAALTAEAAAASAAAAATTGLGAATVTTTGTLVTFGTVVRGLALGGLVVGLGLVAAGMADVAVQAALTRMTPKQLEDIIAAAEAQQELGLVGGEEAWAADAGRMRLAAQAREELARQTRGATDAQRLQVEVIDEMLRAIDVQERREKGAAIAREFYMAKAEIMARDELAWDKLVAQGKDAVAEAVRNETDRIAKMAPAQRQALALRTASVEAMDLEGQAGRELAYIQFEQARAAWASSGAIRGAEAGLRSMEASQRNADAAVRSANAGLNEAKSRLGELSDALNVAQRAIQGYADSWFIGEGALRGAILDIRGAVLELDIAQAKSAQAAERANAGRSAATIEARLRVIDLQIAEEKAGKAATATSQASASKFDMLSAQQAELTQGIPIYVSLLKWQQQQEQRVATSDIAAKPSTALEEAQGQLRLLELEQQRDDLIQQRRDMGVGETRDQLRILQLEAQRYDLQRDRLRLIIDEQGHAEITYAEAKAGLTTQLALQRDLQNQVNGVNAEVARQERLVAAAEATQKSINDLVQGQRDYLAGLNEEAAQLKAKDADRIAALQLMLQLTKMMADDPKRFAMLMREAGGTIDTATGKLKIFGLEFDALPKSIDFAVDDSQLQEMIDAVDKWRDNMAAVGIVIPVTTEEKEARDRLDVFRARQAAEALAIEVAADTAQAEADIAALRSKAEAEAKMNLGAKDSDARNVVERFRDWVLEKNVPSPLVVEIAAAQDAVGRFRDLAGQTIDVLIRALVPPPVVIDVRADTSSFDESVGAAWERWGVAEGGMTRGAGATGEWQAGTRAVPGPVGAAQMAIVHGGERILSPWGGGGTSTTNNYYWQPTVHAQRGEDSVAALRREYTMVRLTGRGLR